MKLGQPIEGTVSAMAFGGEGILRHDGVVVFVPFAVPGDEIEVEITQAKKSFARGKLLKIIQPATRRIEPRCPHFGVCGGCQLQQLPYDEQLKLKHDWVEQSLKRIGKLSHFEVRPVIGASAQWNYRRVVKLRFQRQEQGIQLGYVNALSNGLVNVRTCPIFQDDPSLWETLRALLQDWLNNTTIKAGVLSLFRADDERFVAHLEVDNGPSKQLLSQIGKLPEVLKGLLLSIGASQHTVGDVELGFSQGDHKFGYTALSFVQNHAEQSAKINQRIFDIVAASGAKSVFDLYCGFGVTAIGLAKLGVKVIGVESNPESIRLAKLNASANHAKVEFVCEDVASFLKSRLHTSMPDLIVVNPPRTGLAPSVVQSLAHSGCKHLIYVSCMPQTLARDLAVLTESGYAISECQPYDMFPQTTHVETMVNLCKPQQ